jgi:hypothetical protein
MATLEDVRRFIAEHRNEGLERLERMVAKEFGMTHREASRFVEDAQGGPNIAVPEAAAIADAANAANGPMGVSGTGPTGNAGSLPTPGMGAAAIAVTNRERHEGRLLDGDRDNGRD